MASSASQARVAELARSLVDAVDDVLLDQTEDLGAIAVLAVVSELTGTTPRVIDQETRDLLYRVADQVEDLVVVKTKYEQWARAQTAVRVRDGGLKHRCVFPSWLHNEASWFDRGDEWVCPKCWQVWIALRKDPSETWWRRSRAGFWRRRVRRPVEGSL